MTPHFKPPYTLAARDSNGAAIYDETRPLLALVAGSDHEITFLDNFDYRVLCTGKRQISQIKKRDTRTDCTDCNTGREFSAGGLDFAEGFPIDLAGAAIRGNALVLYWGFAAKGVPVAGSNPVAISVVLHAPRARDSNGNELPSVTVGGSPTIRGTPPTLPGDLLRNQGTAMAPGSLGTPVYSRYILSRNMVKGEAFHIELPSPSVIRNSSPEFPENYPVYHSAPRKDTCERYARDPDSVATEEFL